MMLKFFWHTAPIQLSHQVGKEKSAHPRIHSNSVQLASLLELRKSKKFVTRWVCRSQPIQAKFHPTIDGLQTALTSSNDIHQLSILQLNARVATHVPKLWNLWVLFRRSILHNFISQFVPSWIQPSFGVNQVFCHHRGFGQLAQMEHHTLALGNNVKIFGEGICELLQWVIWQGDRCIFHSLASTSVFFSIKEIKISCPSYHHSSSFFYQAALLRDHLLSSLHAHPHMRNQRVVLCGSHFSLAHNEPFTTSPRFASLDARYRGNGCPRLFGWKPVATSSVKIDFGGYPYYIRDTYVSNMGASACGMANESR